MSASSPGVKPELKWIALDKLYIDHTYQRTTKSKASVKNLEYMRENFSWSHCGALIVCYVKASNKYAVIDGQHRLQAVLARGDIKEMPCMVIHGSDLQRQVDSFVIVNTKRVILNGMAKFHAAVAAGDTDACAVRDLCKQAGVEIPKSPVINGDTGPRQTQAIGTLITLTKMYDTAKIKWALQIIPDAYGEKKGQMRAMLIKALVEFRLQHPDVDRERILQVLRKIDPCQLEKDASAVVRTQGGRNLTAMVDTLARLYKNAGRGGADPLPPASVAAAVSKGGDTRWQKGGKTPDFR